MSAIEGGGPEGSAGSAGRGSGARKGRGRYLRRAGVILAGAALGIAGVFVALDWLLPLPPEVLSPPAPTARLLDRYGAPLAEFATAGARRNEPLDISAMGPFLPAVTVALEDRRFFSHDGADWLALGRAVVANALRPGLGGGASTITQQYVKLVRGRRGAALGDKALEFFYARKLERVWPKRRILAAYLNRLDYGNRLIGPAAAARAYFGKEPDTLTLAEAVFLAGLPRSPARLNPWLRPEAARAEFERSARRLRRLALAGPLPDGTAEGLRAGAAAFDGIDPPAVRAWTSEGEEAAGGVARFFAAEALRRAPAEAGPVRTTLDLGLQRAVHELAARHVRGAGSAGPSAAAVVVLSNAGARVRALVSVDLESPALDVTRIHRSPGSALKPFVYVTALDRRLITAATLLPDTREAARAVYPDYAPQNYSNRYLGPVRAREALANSLNVPAVALLGMTGAREMFCSLEGWGLRFARGFDACGAGFVLGNCEVTPLDVAAAYAALARGGAALEPRWVEGEPARPGRRMASEAACAIVADILCDNEARAREFGPRSALATPVRVAVKTGTSSGFRDAWAAGFTRDHTVVVWAGNSSGRALGGVPAVRAAAPLWRAVVDLLLARGDRPVPGPDPETVRTAEVCSLTGLLPSEASPEVVREYFLPGTEPRESSAGSISIENGRAVPLLGPDYAAWCASPDNGIGARLKPGPGPVILWPEEGAVFALDRGLPTEQQEVELRAAGLEGRAARWLVNGKEVRPAGGRFFWRLRPGRHTVRLELDNGALLERAFSVLEPD